MKKTVFFFIMFLAFSLMTACSPDESYTAGYIELDTEEIVMEPYVQGSSALSGGLNENLTRSVTLTGNLIVSRKEITYYEWMTIKKWGSKHLDYEFYSGGRKGSSSDDCSDEHPATCITWRDAIAWCNALSENEGLEPVYYTDSTFKRIYREAYKYEYEPADEDDYNPEDDYEKNIGPECVKWDADGYRLLTEAEWEFLARTNGSGSVSDGAFYSGYSGTGDWSELGDYAWFFGNTTDTFTTKPVGTRKPNCAGLYDMTGNVLEWCWDEASSYSDASGWFTSPEYGIDERTNPVGPASYPAESEKIVRGGCFSDPVEIASFGVKYLAASYRSSCSPVTIDNAVGFRVCRIQK